MSDDGINVGKAFIEISPRLKTAQATAQTRRYIRSLAKEIDDALGNGAQKSIDAVRDGMNHMASGRKGVLKDINLEIAAHQKLQKQIDSENAKKMRAFELEKKKIADSISAQKSLAKQRSDAFDAEKKKISESISAQKALAKQKEDSVEAEKRAIDKTIADLNSAYDKKRAIEKADADAGLKAAKQYADDEDKAFKYRMMRAAGASPEKAASYATGGKSVRAGEVKAQFEIASKAAKVSGISMQKAFDGASHTLSQLSTRIGLASFQLQLLGGFATTFITGPAALGLGVLAREGLKFAVSIDYARASMQSLLGPSTDVEAVIRDIKQMAIDSPLFNTEDAISYAQKLASVGVKGKDLYKSMQALSNIMLTQGVAGPERANLAMMAYTQILSKGAIGMDDLRQQFAEHVPGGMKIFEEVAKRMGYKTIKGLSDAMKSGEVTAAELNAEFIKFGNTPKYLEGATKSAQTLGGVWQAFMEEVQSNLGMAFDANRKEIIRAIEGIKPVVMSFIQAIVKALPGLINWLNRLVTNAQTLKAKYDALNPAQKEMVQNLVLLALAAGPTAIAVGILGTALSGAANGASLFVKGLAIAGGAVGGWGTVIIAGLAAIVIAIALLYSKSEGMRLAIERVFNRLKDLIATVLLPVFDMLVGSVQSLESTFGFLGLKSEHLAYILGAVLAVPIVFLITILASLVIAIKAVQLVMLILSSIAYGLTNTVAYLIMGFGELFGLLAKIPGAPKEFKEIAESADRSAKKLGGLVDVSGQWKGLTEMNSGATSNLQSRMNALDFTTTGLSGAFTGLNWQTDQAIQKQMTLEDAITNARNAMNGQKSATVGAMDASDNYNKSLLGLKESIDNNGRSLSKKTKEGQANRDMLKQATSASYELMLQDIRSGVPMDQAIQRHKNRTEALKKEFGKNKETQAAAQTLIDTYGKVPPDVETLLKLMGYPDVSAKMQEILAAQKVAANPNMKFADALRVEKKAWDKASNWATGGYIANGPGTTTSDDIFAKLSKKEFVVNAKATSQVGPDKLAYINKYGELPLPGFAKGGPVSWPMNVDVSKTKFPDMLGGGPNSGGMGWVRMMQILRGHFPGLPLISGYRAGAMTSTGNKSYHGMGRAVDLPPRWDVFNWISQNYGRGTKELIYTPAGGRQIKNGQNHVFTGGTIQKDHYNHVHWAYDNGGYIPPNTPFINKTGSSELALNSAQAGALQDKIENSERPVNVSVYVDGVRRDAEIVVEEKFGTLIQLLGGE